MTRWKPRPWQRSQAPCGELKEKIRGSISGIEVPQLRQANFSLKTSTSPRLPALGPESVCAPRRPRHRRHRRSTSSTSTRPSASADGRLDRLGEALAEPLLHDQAVDDDRDVVLELLVEDDLLVEPPQLAVDDGAGVALLAHLLEHPPVLALALADDRRQDHEAGLSASVITRSVICSIDCPAIGSPQLGQCGLPIRDQSSRR